MSATTIFQYILLIALILFTAFNFYAFTVGKKKKQQATNNYQQTLKALEQQAYEAMQERKIHFDQKQGYINDLNEGILITFDHANHLVGITLKDAFYLFGFSDFLGVKQTYDTLENGKLTNIAVEIETKDSVITLLFGTKEWKRNSYLGKFLLSDSQELCTLLERECKSAASTN
ncbi:MAG: hypothetical protein AB7C91_04675 [Sphaerochaeta sp.]|jgi:hypothetical protein|uniref:hypothetical protein n=1 Tax=Sphaerochaeta sp. TaxID=1972642 RepID=UPI002FC95B97